MIIYYDILLLNGQSLINVRHSERFKILSGLIACRTGWAELVHREVIDFNQTLGASSLRRAFARVILAKGEGLVLKPDDPYFDFAEQRQRFSSCCIKLKKEYIGTFGDIGDFAVVGARYDPARAKSYKVTNLQWTHFYIGCLENKDQVKRWSAPPELTVVSVVELNETMLKDFVNYASPRAVPVTENSQLKLKTPPGVDQGNPLTTVFTHPPVFEMRCFSFDKPGNTGFWTLRFPAATKIHFDRDFTDAISFDELQSLAKEATEVKERDW